MKLHYFFITAICFGLLACDQNKEKTTVVKVSETEELNEPEPPAPPEAPAPPPVKEFKTKTGKVFLLEETHPRGMSLTDIKVMFANDSSSGLNFSDLDPVNKVLLGDLDNNGFDELYIITTAAGSGSYGNLRGFASLRDKSIGLVNLPELSAADKAKGGKFEGYEGHDEFNIIDNKLVRTFPIRSDLGKQRTVSYKMIPGEAAYQLVPVSSSVQ